MKQHLTPQQWLRVDAVWQKLSERYVTHLLMGYSAGTAGGLSLRADYYLLRLTKPSIWDSPGVHQLKRFFAAQREAEAFDGTGWHANTVNGDIVFRIV